MVVDRAAVAATRQARPKANDGAAGSDQRDPLHGAFGLRMRMLPVHFPPWQTVYWWLRRFVRLTLLAPSMIWR
jgi:transposase